MSNILFIAAILAAGIFSGNNLADHVNTAVGVIDNRGSNCVIGPMLPYGSINPSPQTQHGGMDGYSPAEPIDGFAQLHVSGTGWTTYGHFLIQPQTGELQTGYGTHSSNHSADVTLPYLYATTLDRYGVRVEISPAHYSAIYRFTYPETADASILLDAAQSIATDIEPRVKGRVKETSTEVDAATGKFRMMIHYSGGWPEGPYKLYVSGQISKSEDAGLWETGTHSGGYFRFSTKKNEQVLLKLAISFTSYDTADALLSREIPGWDFDKVVRNGKRAWNNKLSTIKADFQTAEQDTLFYSSMYRSFTLARDRSLDNSKWESTLPFWDDNYAYWDTFRTAWPLIALLDQDAARDHILSIIDRFEHNGRVYDGFIAGMERTSEQGGNDVDCVISDAYLKGVGGVDWNKAYEVVKFNAEHRGKGYVQHDGWIPNSIMSTSTTLEYAYNDWCVSLMAAGLGLQQDAERYAKRSHNWVYLWNPELEDSGYKGFIDARTEDGIFSFIDAQKYGGSWISPFYEGSSWTYSYFVPHDFERLIELMGGPEAFVQRLEYGFENKLIKYDNEPGFLASRAFVHAGRPDLSSKWVHGTLAEGFDTTGYPGNDDTGSMSSWFIFCTLGLCPSGGQDFYYLSAPALSKAEIRLAGGKKLLIKANASAENTRIISCKVNGREWTEAVLPHSEIAGGGTIEFILGPQN